MESTWFPYPKISLFRSHEEIEESSMEESKEVSKALAKCQICSMNTHLADECPFRYTVCKQPNCNGIRVLKKTKVGRKFLRCQHSSCIGFQWLDETILDSNGGSSSSISACFACGDTTHWIKDCPWKAFPCPTKGYSGIMNLLISGSPLNKDRPYLKCATCSKFQWLNDAKDEHHRDVAAAARMFLGSGIDDFCKKFKKNMSM